MLHTHPGLRRATPDELAGLKRLIHWALEFDEVADGVPQLRDVAVDATMDDRFLQRAIVKRLVTGAGRKA